MPLAVEHLADRLDVAAFSRVAGQTLDGVEAVAGDGEAGRFGAKQVQVGLSTWAMTKSGCCAIAASTLATGSSM
jgi:hypothetical protein